MKTFKHFLAEAAQLPSTHDGSDVPGVKVKIKSADGWNDCTVKQVTPDSAADKAYWEISMDEKIYGRIPVDQTKGMAPNEERILTIDKTDFWFGGRQAGGKFFEAYIPQGAHGKAVGDMDSALKKQLGVSTSKKTGRQEFEYTVNNKPVYVNWGGEDDSYATVSVGGKDKDFTRGGKQVDDIAKYLKSVK